MVLKRTKTKNARGRMSVSKVRGHSQHIHQLQLCLQTRQNAKQAPFARPLGVRVALRSAPAGPLCRYTSLSGKQHVLSPTTKDFQFFPPPASGAVPSEVYTLSVATAAVGVQYTPAESGVIDENRWSLPATPRPARSCRRRILCPKHISEVQERQNVLSRLNAVKPSSSSHE